MSTTYRKTRVPLDLVNAFWNEVEKSLRRAHAMTSIQSLRGILRYRNELDSIDIADLLYHSAPHDVACHIVTGGYTQAHPPPAD